MGGYAGTEFLTLTNADQNLPLTFTVRVSVSSETDEALFGVKVVPSLRVQERTGQPIVLPARVFFTDEDIDDLSFIESVLATGTVEAESLSVTRARAPGDTAENWRRRFSTVSTDFNMAAAWVRRRLFDNYLDLGPMRIADQPVRFKVEDIEAAIATLEVDETLTVTVVPAAASSLRVTYPRWTPQGASLE
ncbi:MAG TPA: hypothetical protein VJZ76_17845 [Thermoanaerobaculia bacterium]|nr:hypothetical protein [Thermoanaerobaculia bacterium]